MSRNAQFSVGAVCALGLVAFALHAANMIYLAQAEGCRSFALVCPGDPSQAWSTPDTQGYLRLAERVREHGPRELDTMWRMPAYPLVLAAALALFGQPTPALWLAAALAGLAAAAIAGLAAWLAGSRAAGWTAGALFCLWPSSYAHSALLLTDAAHAYSAVIALVSTVAWRASERPSRAALAGAAWLAAQTLRPTFAALPLLLPLLLVKRGAGRRYGRVSLCLWLASLAGPASIVTNNWMRHGVAVVSALPSFGIACETGSLIRTSLGEGHFRPLRADCVRRYAGRPWAERIPAEWSEGLGLYRANPGAAVRLHLRALRGQMLHPISLSATASQKTVYPTWVRVGSSALLVFWLAAAAAALWLLRRDPALGLFLLLATGLVMGPASHTVNAGNRYRLVLDFYYLPVVVAGATAALRAVRARRPARAR